MGHRKNILQNTTFCHNKNTQQTRKRREFPQPDNGHP